jgi:hypothetical protein
VSFGLFGLQRFSLRCDLTKELSGVGFVTAFLMCPGELPGPLCLDARLMQPASQQICLTQPDHPQRMLEQLTHRDRLCDGLLQQWQGT